MVEYKHNQMYEIDVLGTVLVGSEMVPIRHKLLTLDIVDEHLSQPHRFYFEVQGDDVAAHAFYAFAESFGIGQIAHLNKDSIKDRRRTLDVIIKESSQDELAKGVERTFSKERAAEGQLYSPYTSSGYMLGAHVCTIDKKEAERLIPGLLKIAEGTRKIIDDVPRTHKGTF